MIKLKELLNEKHIPGHDKEGKMAKYDAKEACEDAAAVFKMIDEYDDLPEWLEAKITKASDYLNSVKDYLTHHHSGTNETNEASSLARWSDDKKLLRWKVYIDGEKEPLILTGRSANEVKKFAHKMIQNNKVKIKKVVKEIKITESWDSPQKYSSPEAGKVIDGAIRDYAKDLRKVQGRVVKDWMSKAKAGVIDYFDIVRGLTTGDVTKAHPYETEFLQKVLNKDKIVQRFRQYFGGKKGKRGRRK